jgi:hypothetical protein
MEKLPHYYFSWIVASRNREKCEMLPLEMKQSGGNLLPHSDLRGGGEMFLEGKPRGRSYSEDYKQKQKKRKEHQSFKIGTWNVKALNQGGKPENLKKNSVSVLGVS